VTSNGMRAPTFENAGRSTRRRVVLRLEPTTRRLEIRTDDPWVENFTRAAYAAHVDDDELSLPTDCAEVLTATSPTRATFAGRALPAPRDSADPWGSSAYVVHQCVWQALARDPLWYALYGCVAELPAGAVVLVGPGEVGKTTLGLALAARGAHLLGDEMALLHRRLPHVAAIRRALTIRSGSLEMLARDPFAHGPAGGSSAPIPLAALLFLRRSTDGAPHALPLPPGRGALQLARALAAKPNDAAELALLGSRLCNVATYELSLADPDATARLVERLVR
jgi:hypothetical protein